MIRPIHEISITSMNHQRTNQPCATPVTSKCGFSSAVPGILVLLTCSAAGWGAETATPLITPAITPAQEKPKDQAAPAPALGFPASPADASGFNALPGDPNAVLPGIDELPAPMTAEDLSKITNSLPADSKPPTLDFDSNDGDFADPLKPSPRTPSSGPSGPGMTGAWPNGFSDSPANIPIGDGVLDDLREGLEFSASLSGTYDTNPSQGYAATDDSGQGDFFTTLGGTAAYRSTASTWTYGATYSGSYNQYFNQSELSGHNQSAGASLNYQGGPLTAALIIGINYGSGANRYYASVVDEISFNYSLNAQYRISPKTSITGDFSQNLTSVSGDDVSDTDAFNLGIAALWHYSPLLEFGPGIRYTSDSRSNAGLSRTSIGPTVTANYQLAKKVSLTSRIGMDFAEYDNGESVDPSWSTSISLNYQASRLWGMNLSLQRDAQTSYTAANEFEELTLLRLGYNRRIRRASWTLGMGWETRPSENSNSSSQSDRDYLSFDTALSMPVFADTCNASIFMRYSDQSGDANEAWDSFQTGFNISRSF